MTSTNPRISVTVITALVVRDVKVHSESVAVKRDGRVEIVDLEYDGHKAVLVVHADILA